MFSENCAYPLIAICIMFGSMFSKMFESQTPVDFFLHCGNPEVNWQSRESTCKLGISFSTLGIKRVTILSHVKRCARWKCVDGNDCPKDFHDSDGNLWLQYLRQGFSDGFLHQAGHHRKPPVESKEQLVRLAIDKPTFHPADQSTWGRVHSK